MKSTILFIILVISIVSNAQEFSFSLYFEDAIGNKDTITCGYDINATDSIDSIFDGVSVETPFDSVFEIRITDAHALYYKPLPFLLKRQISSKRCEERAFPAVYALLVKCKYYPLTIGWDNNLFNNTCREKSFITDWYIGGWFDAVSGKEQGPFFLKDTNSVKLSHIGNNVYQLNYKTISDTVRILYLAVSSSINYGYIVNVSYTTAKDIKVFSVSSKDIIYIEINNDKIVSVQMVDLFGRSILYSYNNYINISNVPKGIYLLRIKTLNSKTVHVYKIFKS